MLSQNKRQNGSYYTEGNPFVLKPFLRWASKIELKNRVVLEPFAGSNNIIKSLLHNDLIENFCSFDISPASQEVQTRDTIKSFPKGFDVVITNPPWLARNSANRRGLCFVDTKYDDLYKHCLSLCLKNCKYVAILIPATFLQSELFIDRLEAFILLRDNNIFLDTDNPVALALFSEKAEQTKIYYDDDYIGNLEEFKKYIPEVQQDRKIIFNYPKGDLGFIAFDNTRENSIKFVRGEEIREDDIKHTSRMITRIDIGRSEKMLDELIYNLNNDIEEFREETRDVFLTPFKGLRQDGMYRRRMNYSLAKRLILQYDQ